MKSLKVIQILILSIITSNLYGQTPPNIMGNYASVTNTFTIKTIATSADQVSKPRDLDFNTNGDLWIINQGTENSGGSTVTIKNPGLSTQTSEYKQDPNAWHFMSLPSGIAFGSNTNFGTSTSVYDANHNGGTPFTGPALWPSAEGVYAVELPGANGSHLDMLHASPYCMGIAWEKDNVYWVTDMNSNDVVRYDFEAPHQPGGSYHGDAIIRRYTGQSISWINQNTSAHLAFDDNKKWLYVVDGGGKKIVRLDINTGVQGGNPTFPNQEPVAEYKNYDGATWQTVVDSGLIKPVGIAVIGNYMAVSDNENGDIIIYDITSVPATELNRVKTSAGIQGIDIGPDGRIWFVNTTTNTVATIEPAVVTSINELITNSSLLHIYPNPSTGKFRLTIDGLNQKLSAEIIDMNGALVKEITINGNDTEIDITNLAKGIYFLKVRNNEYNITKKIVLQ